MEYTVIRKNIKHLRIILKPTGEIVVSAPLYSTDKAINEFVEKNKSWIIDNMNKAVDITLRREIFEGGTNYILGNPYILRIIKSDKSYVLLDNGFIKLYTKDDELEKIEKIYDKFLNDLRIKVYKETIDKYLTLTGLSLNALKIKHMTRSNGRCYFERKEIILSSLIIHKTIDFIEAICMHEIAHLKYPNHQKEFYEYIYRIMPDYKEKLRKRYN